MIKNITLLSLNIISLYSMSPLYTINSNSYYKTTYLCNSKFMRFYSNVLYSNTEFQSSIVKNNAFIQTFNTPLVFTDGDTYEGVCLADGSKCCFSTTYNFQKNTAIKGQTVSQENFPNNWAGKHPIFVNDLCGPIQISECTFKNCGSTSDFGGGLLVEANLEVILHHCVFDSCYSKRHGAGGAIGKRMSYDEKYNEPGLEDAKRLDIQYTCFQDNYQTDDNQGFGSALIMAANDVVLFYASTVNCPRDKKAYGAQFDIKAENSITSQFVNSSGGHSRFCGTIEYRSAKKGFFRFQTLTQMRCKYVTSFTSVIINQIVITSCNVNNNTISQDSDDLRNMPSLIFVREKPLLVKNFYFFNNVFRDNGKVAERDIKYGHTKIIIEDSFMDFNDQNKWDTSYVSIVNCDFNDKTLKSFPLRQLKLGHCEGEIPPGPMIISSFFTASSPFSDSNDFTKSSVFSHSSDFSESKVFTNSQPFSKTDEFTETEKFSQSEKFSKSNSFPPSSAFTSSNTFTDSDRFDQTHRFTKSKTFSPSKKFSSSKIFSNSLYFTESNAFSDSNQFSQSSGFTCSSEFTKSDEFSQSSIFTVSDCFSQSDDFSMSDHFTPSYHFTKSNIFTSSYQFSESFFFSKSEIIYVPIIKSSDSDNTDKFIIIGAVVGAVAGAAAIAAVVFFLIKRPTIVKDEPDVIKETGQSVTVENGLQSLMNEDDPFANDFNDELLN